MATVYARPQATWDLPARIGRLVPGVALLFGIGYGGKLAETGKAERRELYPKQRVNFPKGASGTTLTVTIPAGEIKRFVVGARAGQNLTVSVSDKDASLRLLEDVETVEGINNFRARLPKNGDYTIEIQNNAANDLEITVNVKIL